MINVPGYIVIPTTTDAMKNLSNNIAGVTLQKPRKKRQADGLYEISPKLFPHQQNSFVQFNEKDWKGININVLGVTDTSGKAVRYVHCRENKKNNKSSYHYEDLNSSPRELADICTQTVLTCKGIDTQAKTKLLYKKSAKHKVTQRKGNKKMKKKIELKKQNESHDLLSPTEMIDTQVQTDDSNITLFSWIDQIDCGATFSNIETQTINSNDIFNCKQWNYDDLMDIGTQTNNMISKDDTSTQTTKLINQLLSADSYNIATQTNDLKLFDDASSDQSVLFDVHFNIDKENSNNFIDSSTQTLSKSSEQADCKFDSSTTQTNLLDFQEVLEKLDYDNLGKTSFLQSAPVGNNMSLKNETNTLSTQTSTANDFLLENLPDNMRNDLLLLDSLLHLPSESNDFATQTFEERLCSSATQTFTNELNQASENNTLQNNMETQTSLSLDHLFTTDFPMVSEMIGKETISAETQTLFCDEKFDLF